MDRSSASTPRRFDGADVAVVLLLAGVTVAYLLAWPRKLGIADESYFLFEAKRLRDGEVMYRDFFEFITPLAHQTMALAYRLFGTTLETARAVMAAVLAAAVCLVYAAARVLGVRRVLAVVPALALVGFGYPTFPEASPHWFATALIALLALGLVGWRWDLRVGPAFALGVVDGAIISMQQQKGVFLGVGLAAVLVIHALIVTLVARGQGGRGVSLLKRLAALAAGALVVVGVVLGSAALAAGMRPVFDAVVRYPLESYRPAGTVGWGGIAPFMDFRALPIVLVFYRWLPLALVIPLGRALAALRATPAADVVRPRVALVVLAASSAAAITYYPDFIHIAFIAPAFLVGGADSLEWLVTRVPGPARVRSGVAVALAGVLLVVVGVRARDAVQGMRTEYRVTHDTAFGAVDFTASWYGVVIDRLRRELDASPTREMFAYPQMASPYLVADGKNPTPFQMFNGGNAPAAQIDLLLDTLDRRRVPLVVVNPFLMFRPRDRVAAYIKEHYEPLDVPGIDTYTDIVVQTIYRRREDADGTP